jgi:DNA-binding transcriptional LysR family regulator
MSIEFEDLRVFLAVVDQGSFGRAASELGFAQPSVSNRIASLERRVGRTLFDRSTRGATLTPAGERLVPHARRGVQVIEDAQAATRAVDYQPPVRVLLSASYASVLLPVVVDAFEQLDRRLSISYDHGPSVVRAIATERAEVGFLAPCPYPANVVLRSLGSSPVVAAIAPGHPLTAVRRPTLADLGRHPVALSSWGDDAAAFVDHLPAHPRTCTVFPVSAAAQLARDRAYVAIAPRAALASELRSGALVHLAVGDLPRAKVELALASHRAGMVPIDDLVSRARRALRVR